MKFLACLAALAACGDSSKASPDAMSDAAPDASSDAKVTVYAPYSDPTSPGPTPGATVLVYSSAGDLIDRQRTDASGIATVTGPDNATVAVIPPGGSSGHPYVWVGVAPGEHLYTVSQSGGTGTGQATAVTIPSDGTDVSEYYVVGWGFDAEVAPAPTSPVVTLAGSYRTDKPAVSDLVGIARHAHDRYFVVHDVRLDAGTIDLSTATWVDAVGRDVAISGIPADVAWLNAGAYQRGWSADPWLAFAHMTTPAAAFTAHFDGPPPAAEDQVLHLLYKRGDANDSTAPIWTGSFHPIPQSLDLGAVTIDPTDVAVSNGTRITWGAQGDLSLARGVHLAFEAGTSWEVILPPDARSFELPPIPADLAIPLAVSQPHVSFVSSNEPGGYASVRTAGEVFRGNLYGNIDPPPGYFRLVGY